LRGDVLPGLLVRQEDRFQLRNLLEYRLERTRQVTLFDEGFAARNHEAFAVLQEKLLHRRVQSLLNPRYLD
jgi:hypothetical protein